MLQALLTNYLLLTSLISYIIAQTFKSIMYYIINKKIDFKRIVGAGGMPSSHSATVAGLSVAAVKKCGPDSSITAVAIVLAIIVIYDAIGVRQQTGKHAQLLNIILRKGEYADNSVQLNEMVGHTGLQVVVGVSIGIIVALIMPVS